MLIESPNVLPDSRCRKATQTKFVNGIAFEPVYCMNCGCLGVWVPQENIDFAGYLCVPCAEKPELNRIFGAFLTPDEAYLWPRIKEAQVEAYGRELLPHEWEAALANDGTTNDLKRLKNEADARHRIVSTRST